MRLHDSRYREAAVLLLIMLAAAAVRFYHITILPAGLHGDEVVPALEAQRILKEGYIGPYSPLALGQPTGPMYFLAPFLKLFGNTIWTVRAFAAIIGILTVLLFYVFLRRNFGRKVAAVGALLLAFSGWHIHFSRIGFPLISWPFYAVLAVMVLAEALRHNDWRWWCMAGAAAGSGVYSYNAHLLFIGVLLLFCIWYIGTVRDVLFRQRVCWLAAYGVALVMVALPLLLYIANPANDYFGHARYLSIFEQPEWKALGRGGQKIGFVVGRYLDFWDIMTRHPQLDFGDGTGITPLISPLILLLAAAGILIAWKRREPLLICVTLIVLLMPLASVITTAGQARRTFALLPFLLLFAALAIVTLFEYLQQRSTLRSVSVAIPLALIAFLAWQDLSGYFGAFANAPVEETVFATAYTDAVKWMQTLPPGSYVYLSCDTNAFNYETRRYLVPDLQGEDRASRFGPRDFSINVAQGTPVFLFVAQNQELMPEVQRLYPGGKTVTGGLQGRRSFVAYWPPASS